MQLLPRDQSNHVEACLAVCVSVVGKPRAFVVPAMVLEVFWLHLLRCLSWQRLVTSHAQKLIQEPEPGLLGDTCLQDSRLWVAGRG